MGRTEKKLGRARWRGALQQQIANSTTSRLPRIFSRSRPPPASTRAKGTRTHPPPAAAARAGRQLSRRPRPQINLATTSDTAQQAAPSIRSRVAVAIPIPSGHTPKASAALCSRQCGRLRPNSSLPSPPPSSLDPVLAASCFPPQAGASVPRSPFQSSSIVSNSGACVHAYAAGRSDPPALPCPIAASSPAPPQQCLFSRVWPRPPPS